jgi:hypothetical protein
VASRVVLSSTELVSLLLVMLKMAENCCGRGTGIVRGPKGNGYAHRWKTLLEEFFFLFII